MKTSSWGSKNQTCRLTDEEVEALKEWIELCPVTNTWARLRILKSAKLFVAMSLERRRKRNDERISELHG